MRFIAIGLSLCALLAACTSNQTRGAAQGAGAGAIAGAAGAMVTALVFGGDVGEAAARGAVYGGTVGAVGGAMAGTSQDKREAEARKREEQKTLDALRKKIGDDAFDGAAQLVQCKHEVALAYGKTAARSANTEYAQAGLWVQALTLDDQGDADGTNAVISTMIANGYEDSMDSATQELTATRSQLAEIRSYYGLPKSCSG